jgi:hypothetical protein
MRKGPDSFTSPYTYAYFFKNLHIYLDLVDDGLLGLIGACGPDNTAPRATPEGVKLGDDDEKT